jgi:competence protein ComEA
MSGAAAAGLFLVAALAAGTTALLARADAPTVVPPSPLAIISTPAASPTLSSATVIVHVAGLVADPGVYELPAGSRVVDALEAAGGAQPGADTSGLNLARVLVDGEQVAVGVPRAPDGAGAGTSSDPSAPLDLNTATADQLDELPGVGPVLAARIMAWREEHGGFTAVDELLEVSGIGSATYAEIAPLVRV